MHPVRQMERRARLVHHTHIFHGVKHASRSQENDLLTVGKVGLTGSVLDHSDGTHGRHVGEGHVRKASPHDLVVRFKALRRLHHGSVHRENDIVIDDHEALVEDGAKDAICLDRFAARELSRVQDTFTFRTRVRALGDRASELRLRDCLHVSGLLDRVFSAQMIHTHGPGLTEAIGPRGRLHLLHRIPRHIDQNDARRARYVETHTAQIVADVEHAPRRS